MVRVMKKRLKVIIVCASLIVAALLIYQIVNYGPIYFWMIYVDKTYHPFKEFDEFRDDYMVMVEIIKRNMNTLEITRSNAIIWYGSKSDTRIEMLTDRSFITFEIFEEEKESVRRLNYLYRGWSSVTAYENYIWFHSEDGVYELAYSLDGNPPPTVHAKNGAEYYKPIDLGGGWYALSMKVD